MATKIEASELLTFLNDPRNVIPALNEDDLYYWFIEFYLRTFVLQRDVSVQSVTKDSDGDWYFEEATARSSEGPAVIADPATVNFLNAMEKANNLYLAPMILWNFNYLSFIAKSIYKHNGEWYCTV